MGENINERRLLNVYLRPDEQWCGQLGHGDTDERLGSTCNWHRDGCDTRTCLGLGKSFVASCSHQRMTEVRREMSNPVGSSSHGSNLDKAGAFTPYCDTV